MTRDYDSHVTSEKKEGVASTENRSAPSRELSEDKKGGRQ